ncbi:hypothetical protein THIARS_60798 [Thiomonas delicata]|uniref:Uncharacterized protein n=1 Tax=Thiomonas delicata TaxID=364030 RepID=A0A238D4B4_THIDL|nr:hypothetical protein THIARS_60798 [Thiomonas delicata]
MGAFMGLRACEREWIFGLFQTIAQPMLQCMRDKPDAGVNAGQSCLDRDGGKAGACRIHAAHSGAALNLKCKTPRGYAKIARYS